MQSTSTQPFKVCPKCQQRLALHMTNCGRCGQMQPVLQNIGMPARNFAQSPVAPLIMPCVVCGCHDVKKVSAIVQAGTWTSIQESQSIGYGHVHGGGDFTTVGATVTSGRGATNLAAILAPPLLPQRQGMSLTTLALWVLAPIAAFCLLNFSFSLSDEKGVDMGALLFGLLFGGAVVALYFFGVKENAARNRDADAVYDDWSRAMRLWETLFYCSRCDSVYLPHTRQAVPSRQMHGLIGF